MPIQWVEINYGESILFWCHIVLQVAKIWRGANFLISCLWQALFIRLSQLKIMQILAPWNGLHWLSYNHIQLSIELKKIIGLLRRIRKRVPREKIVIIAEAIFNSLLRYGVAVFLKPIYDKEDLNMEKKTKKYCYPSNTSEQYAKGDFWLSIKESC